MASSKKEPASKKTAPARAAAKNGGAATVKGAASKRTPSAPARPEASKKSAKPAARQTRPAAGKHTSNSLSAADRARRDTDMLLGNDTRRKTNDAKLDPFIRSQKEKLLQLRDAMVDSMAGTAQDTLRSRAEGSEASAFGMHQADAGSDAYDRDFALSLLSQEQDALYEIDEALKRIELGTYGICEMSGKPIMHARLEAIPFARFTVECQSQLEKQNKASRVRQSVTSLFGLTEEEGGEGEEEEVKPDDSKE